ncbi:hypothetical protein E2C01_019325 [Portunus trituberculatus]|uniref:CSD domain-containing protein n=1 Tax=Portunus trituberculatus TaxID=210409 RepID=A0A5B7DXA1_PORTR|nr:hypothetical protein [Portunus trituberculatus]
MSSQYKEERAIKEIVKKNVTPTRLDTTIKLIIYYQSRNKETNEKSTTQEDHVIYEHKCNTTSAKTYVFVHYTGLKRSLKRRLPREGDKVHFTVCEGDKGPEAREVARTGQNSKAGIPSPKPLRRTWDMEVKITACICTAKALAGSNPRRLQVLIPLLLKHNGLPGIRIPQQAFGTSYSHTPRPPRSHQLLRQDDDQPCHDDPAEEAATIEEEEEEGEDEIVDVEGSDSDQPPPSRRRRLDNTQ